MHNLWLFTASVYLAILIETYTCGRTNSFPNAQQPCVSVSFATKAKFEQFDHTSAKDFWSCSHGAEASARAHVRHSLMLSPPELCRQRRVALDGGRNQTHSWPTSAQKRNRFFKLPMQRYVGFPWQHFQTNPQFSCKSATKTCLSDLYIYIKKHVSIHNLRKEQLATFIMHKQNAWPRIRTAYTQTHIHSELGVGGLCTMATTSCLMYLCAFINRHTKQWYVQKSSQKRPGCSADGQMGANRQTQHLCIFP